MNECSRAENAALVALLRARPQGLSWPEMTSMVIESGSAVRVWESLTPPVLMPRPGEPDPIEQAGAEMARWEATGNTMTTVLDSGYPSRLMGIHQAPAILFTRGALWESDTAVSVVGSRKASPRGLSIAAEVSCALVSEGVSVIAGLAVGIDTAAHVAAMEAGGRTVAVIATGINKTYPASNRALHEAIANRGLLLSQFWPDAPPQKHTFLMRNATMSGYGIATVVVEAGEHSGARAQARMAVEHGRPVILTDLVTERNVWARELIGRPGVHVAAGIRDVIEAIRGIRAADSPADVLRLLASA